MAGINKVILVGNLGQKPELKHSTNGNAMTTLSVATSETWKDKTTGEKKEKTEWHRVQLFAQRAEFAAKYLDKGSKVYVEGKMETRKWQDAEGKDRYTTEIGLGFNGILEALDKKPIQGQVQQAQVAPVATAVAQPAAVEQPPAVEQPAAGPGTGAQPAPGVGAQPAAGATAVEQPPVTAPQPPVPF